LVAADAAAEGIQVTDFWSSVPVRPDRARPKLRPPVFHEIDRIEAERGRLDKTERPEPLHKGKPMRRKKK
jgi:hypothetical protein